MKQKRAAVVSRNCISKKIERARNRKDNSVIRTAVIIGPIILFGFVYLLAKFVSLY